jgi:hypothetical protein
VGRAGRSSARVTEVPKEEGDRLTSSAQRRPVSVAGRLTMAIACDLLRRLEVRGMR